MGWPANLAQAQQRPVYIALNLIKVQWKAADGAALRVRTFI